MGDKIRWGYGAGIVPVDDDVGFVCGVYGFGEFYAHFFFVDYDGFSFFVFALR